jgi:hypothetical protein
LCLNPVVESRTYSRRLLTDDGAMKAFIDKCEDRIHSVLSCFDRMLFRGYLPIMSGWQMAQFFNSSKIRFRELKGFLVQNAERVKRHAMIIAEQERRPFQYLQEKVKKEDLAKQIAERDHIEEGLICIFSVLEPCRTFSFRSEKGKPFVASARRKCLFLYFYFSNRDFGLMHVKLQTWFPLQIQVYVNGHEWLARKLKANRIRYTKHDNAFLWIQDLARAQKFSDGPGRGMASKDRGAPCSPRWDAGCGWNRMNKWTPRRFCQGTQSSICSWRERLEPSLRQRSYTLIAIYPTLSSWSKAHFQNRTFVRTP